MRSSAILGALAAAAALCAACTPGAIPPPRPAVDAARIVDAIKTGEVHWNADWAAKDPVKIADHYAPGAIVMNPGAPAMAGEAAYQAGIRQLLEDDGFTLTFVSDKVDVAASGDQAVSHGTWKATGTDPKTRAVTTSTGSFVTLYKPQADGAWKAVWDIATPGPAPSIGAAMTGAATAKAPQ
ncbi:MAG TPA: nuclear transport factor 2 family protein [Caulobacteraceae bacterium]|nr:nuclear transport factor 2 family protein [Caulobacteraceae bacterium]